MQEPQVKTINVNELKEKIQKLEQENLNLAKECINNAHLNSIVDELINVIRKLRNLEK
jgi:hypothetical protein